MSKLNVKVAKIDEVLQHPNADRLSILVIGGWKTCTANVERDGVWVCPYEPGDLVVYVPPDAVVPDDVAERWGVKDYLGSGNRVKTVKLRGCISRGFAVPVPVEGLPLGVEPIAGCDLTDHYGIVKWEPPVPVSEEHEAETDGFTRYTSIERLQNYPGIFAIGEEVIVTEKIHGTNSRVASMLTDDGVQVLCGTRTSQVKQGTGSKYETPLHLLEVVQLLASLREKYQEAQAIVLFGEIFGRGVQKHLDYGYEKGEYGYRAFDIAVNGEYLSWARFHMLCAGCGVLTVPWIWNGPFSTERIEELSDGRSTIGGDHVREGVVVKPIAEREDDVLGRVILKSIGDGYETKQYGWTDSH